MECDCKKHQEGFAPKVVVPEQKCCPVMFRLVKISASMGDDTVVKPENGLYRNVILSYEANNHTYLYSSDGVPTRLNNGMTNYDEATNLPKINSVTLIGNKTSDDLGIQSKLTAGDNVTIENNVISATDTTYGPATETQLGLVKIGGGLDVSIDGTLTTEARTFDTVADMKAATNLVAGDYAKTLGFHTLSDGGGALYKITNTGSANELDIISVTGSLFAHLVEEENVKQYGAYGDNTHDDTSAIQRALTVFSTSGKVLVIPTGIYLTDGLGCNSIIIKATNATIKAKSNYNTYLLTVTGTPTIDGLNFDGDTKIDSLIQINGLECHIANCIFKNCLNFAIHNTCEAEEDNEAYFESIKLIDCTGGVSITGYPYDDPDDYKGSVKFINCSTEGNCGTNNLRIYYFTKLDYVSVQGGNFTGNVDYGATNIYMVNHGEVIGGYYHDMMRGVTLGQITKNCVVTDTINENIKSAGGLHIDLVTQDRVYPEAHSIIANNIVKNAYRGMYIQGKNILINNNYIYAGSNTVSTGGVIRFNDADDNTANSNVFVDGLYVFNLGEISGAISCGTSVITLGKLYLNGNHIIQSSLMSDNPIYIKNTITATSGTVPVTINDEIIIISATGTTNIMLPNANECKALGKQYKIIRTDNTSYSVQLRCRSDNGTIDGVASSSSGHPLTTGVTNVVQTGAGTYYTY